MGHRVRTTAVACLYNLLSFFLSDILERNSKRGIAMLAVADMWVNLTIKTGSAFMMMSGISTLQTESATTHWFAQR